MTEQTNEDLIRTKLELEIEKIKADKRKAEIEIEELQKPFFKKHAFLQSALIAFVTVLVTGLGVGWTIYNGFQQLNLGRQQADKKELEKNYQDLEKKNNDALIKNKELENERANLDGQILEQKREKERLANEKLALEKESLEIRKEKAQIDDQLKVLTAKSVVQQGQQQSTINGLQLRRQQLEDKNKEIEAKTVQLEHDVITSEVKGSYLLLRAATKLPNYIRADETLKSVDAKTLAEYYAEAQDRYKGRDAAYKKGFVDFVWKKTQNDDERPSALMLAYMVTDEPEWKNELLNVAKARPVLYFDNSTKNFYYDQEMFSCLLAALTKNEEDKLLLYSILLEGLESFDNAIDRNRYLSYFYPLFVTMGTNEVIPDKQVFLRLIAIARDDFLENGPGVGSEILLRRSYRAYFATAGKFLAENNDVCNGKFRNVNQNNPNCNSETVRLMVIARAGVIGVGGAGFGTPVIGDQTTWQNWLAVNNEVVSPWLERDFRSLYLNDNLYKELTTGSTWFKLN